MPKRQMLGTAQRVNALSFSLAEAWQIVHRLPKMGEGRGKREKKLPLHQHQKLINAPGQESIRIFVFFFLYKSQFCNIKWHQPTPRLSRP